MVLPGVGMQSANTPMLRVEIETFSKVYPGIESTPSLKYSVGNEG